MVGKTCKSYKDLIIWQIGDRIFSKVCEDIRRWPANRVAHSIYYQLLDSSGSISANIAEGYGRGSPREFEQFLRYSRGSGAETDNWLYQSLKNNLITKERYDEYSDLFDQPNRMIGGFINSLRKQRKRI